MQPQKQGSVLDFRPVYLRPTRLSDEAITVGLIVNCVDRIVFMKVDHPGALTNLQTFFGEQQTRQVIVALQEISESIAARSPGELEHFLSPNDLLEIGGLEQFFAEDPVVEGRQLLRSLSSLYAADFQKNAPSPETIPHRMALRRLKSEVGRLNIMEGTRIFQGLEVPLPNTKRMRFPICGNHSVGDVVSFVTPKVLQAKTYSEASVARLAFARRRTNLRPALYVLVPSSTHGGWSDVLDDAMGELRLIVQEYEIRLREDKAVSELAHAVLKDAIG